MRKNLLFLITAILLSGCDIINPEEPIPAYIHIASFDLQTDPSTEGSNSSNITDVWLFDGGDFLGSFPLPATIPIIKKGLTTLTLKAGIKDNGITATPDFYPFYKPYEVTIDLKEAQVDTIQPVIGYLEHTKFALIEPFDAANHVFDEIRIGDVENKVFLNNTTPYEGTSSALVKLDTSHSLVELATGLNFKDLTKTGLKVYLEVNYKTDVKVAFGLIGYDNTNPTGEVLFEHGVTESTEWKKIYFNVSAVAITNHFDFYKVAFRSVLPKENGKFKLDNAQIQLDNIKLLHF